VVCEGRRFSCVSEEKGRYASLLDSGDKAGKRTGGMFLGNLKEEVRKCVTLKIEL